ncbi:hypothetical protein EV179_003623 [Coemansia sp. RSA 487]|nr:hypothetical protein EV179_003623 [Coemansia sp. RSA 487]
MTNRRRPSAGAIAKEHHVSRTGYDVRAPIKKGGNGSHNWGTGLNDSLEYDTYDALSREEFEKSKQWSNM